MTDIEQKALELVNAVRAERGMTHDNCINRAIDYDEAFCRALEAHEADKARHAAEMREQAERFSEAAKLVHDAVPPSFLVATEDYQTMRAILSPFILAPDDPLYEALKAVVELGRYDTAEQTQLLRGELEARGLAIVKKEAVNG